MKFPILSLSVAFFACLYNASAAGEHHYTRMIQSKPVAENGLEFAAAVEEKWVCFRPYYGPVEIQLLIRNTTTVPILFSTYQTFGIILKNSKGKKLDEHGGGGVALLPKPVLIGTGETYSLSR